jgi:hypothetical protein
VTFKPGDKRPPGAGRKAGQPNRMTRAVRDALLEAFDRRGGVDFLVTLPDEVFARLLARLVPNEIAARVESESVVRLVDLSDRREAEPGDIEAVDPGIPPLDLRSTPRELAPPAAPPAPTPIPIQAPPPAIPTAAPIFLQRPDFDDFQEWAD